MDSIVKQEVSLGEVSISGVEEENGNLPVVVQDQTTQPLDIFFVLPTGAETVLSVAPSIDDTDIDVNSAVGFSVGDLILLLSAQGRFYQGQIVAINSNTLSLDTPLDFAFSIDDEVIGLSKKMNIDGSTTSQTFKIRGDIGTVDIPVSIDITRIIGIMKTETTPQFGDFGDIENGLTKGIVIRSTNGVKKNLFNLKSNGEISNICYDLQIFSGGFFGDSNGLAFRITFAGQDKHGVAIRLAPDESLDCIIQDDLSSLVSFNLIAEGHIVQD